MTSAVVYLVWGLLGVAALGLWLVVAFESRICRPPWEVLDRLPPAPLLRIVIVCVLDVRGLAPFRPLTAISFF